MQKNVAGQKIGAEIVNASTGAAFTGAVTVYVTGDAGTQAIGSVGGGLCTHEGNGYHTYAPSQAETNYNLIAFTFIGSGAIPATMQAITDAAFLASVLARLTAITKVYTNPRDPNFLQLVRGEAYDGTSQVALGWTLNKNCSAATVILTIRHGTTDAILLTKAGTGNATGVSVSLAVADTNALTVGTHKFDCRVAFSATSHQYAGLGPCEVLENQTRS